MSSDIVIHVLIPTHYMYIYIPAPTAFNPPNSYPQIFSFADSPSGGSGGARGSGIDGGSGGAGRTGVDGGSGGARGSGVDGGSGGARGSGGTGGTGVVGGPEGAGGATPYRDFFNKKPTYKDFFMAMAFLASTRVKDKKYQVHQLVCNLRKLYM